MTIPLMFLAAVSIFAGFIPFSRFVTTDGKAFETTLNYMIAVPSVLIALIGIGIAYFLYFKESNVPDKISSSLGIFYKTALNKFYFDEMWLFVTKKIIFNLISNPIAWFDRHIVDGAMNGVAWVIEKSSYKIKGLQSGQLQQYAFVFISGSVILVLCFIYWLN